MYATIAEALLTGSTRGGRWKALPARYRRLVIASPDGHLGRGPARVSRESGWNDSVLGLVDRLSTFQLFLFWIGTVALSGFGYWTAAPAW